MKTVLLYVSEDNGTESRLQAALDLARAFESHLDCVQVTPFDAIIMTAAAERAPKALLEQLDAGGRMVLPLASRGEQHLYVIERTEKGFVKRRMDPVVFVPLLPGVG